MTKLEQTLGANDSDLLAFREGVGGLAYMGYTDDQIAAFAVEEAQAYRQELNDALAKAGAKPAFRIESEEAE